MLQRSLTWHPTREHALRNVLPRALLREPEMPREQGEGPCPHCATAPTRKTRNVTKEKDGTNVSDERHKENKARKGTERAHFRPTSLGVREVPGASATWPPAALSRGRPDTGLRVPWTTVSLGTLAQRRCVSLGAGGHGALDAARHSRPGSWSAQAGGRPCPRERVGRLGLMWLARAAR